MISKKLNLSKKEMKSITEILKDEDIKIINYDLNNNNTLSIDTSVLPISIYRRITKCLLNIAQKNIFDNKFEKDNNKSKPKKLIDIKNLCINRINEKNKK